MVVSPTPLTRSTIKLMVVLSIRILANTVVIQIKHIIILVVQRIVLVQFIIKNRILILTIRTRLDPIQEVTHLSSEKMVSTSSQAWMVQPQLTECQYSRYKVTTAIFLRLTMTQKELVEEPTVAQFHWDLHHPSLWILLVAWLNPRGHPRRWYLITIFRVITSKMAVLMVSSRLTTNRVHPRLWKIIVYKLYRIWKLTKVLHLHLT